MRNFGSSAGCLRFGLAVLVVSALVVAAPSNSTAQQRGQGQYVTEAAARLGKQIEKANNDGYFFQDNNFSIGGGWIKQSQQNWVPLYTLNLQAGKKYRFIAAGDRDAQDVDLEIKDSDGKTVKFDADADPIAIVNFTPATTGKYLVRLRLYKSDNSDPCLCLAVVMSAK